MSFRRLTKFNHRTQEPFLKISLKDWSPRPWIFVSTSKSCQRTWRELLSPVRLSHFSNVTQPEVQTVPGLLTSPSGHPNSSTVGRHLIDQMLYYHEELRVWHLYCLLGLELQFFYFVSAYSFLRCLFAFQCSGSVLAVPAVASAG